jgi:hypothetical protein
MAVFVSELIPVAWDLCHQKPVPALEARVISDVPV